jgi:hypothetical protein
MLYWPPLSRSLGLTEEREWSIESLIAAVGMLGSCMEVGDRFMEWNFLRIMVGKYNWGCHRELRRL